MGWLNQDGLYIKYGAEEATVGTTGEFSVDGPSRIVESVIDLTKIGSTSAIVDYNAFLPKDGFIESVEIETVVAVTSGGSATFSMGLYRSDYAMAISETALINAIPVASIAAAGTRVTLIAGSSNVGSSIGTKPGFAVNLSAKYGTAAFTAGVVKVRVRWSK